MLTKQGHYRFGSSCGSLETLCKEFALDWSQDPLTILGVTFADKSEKKNNLNVI